MMAHDEGTELAALWRAFAAENKDLLETDPEDMTADQLEKVVRMSDPLLDLVGYVELQQAESPAYQDPRFLAWLAERGVLDEELLDAAQIKALARRIVNGLDAYRLRVLTPTRKPDTRRLDQPGPASVIIGEAAARHESALIDLDVAAGSGRALWDVECELCIPLPAELPRGRHLALKVSGESMEPLVHTGDVIVVRLGIDVERDTVVVARGSEDGYVVKRVGKVSRRSLELLSLNPAFPPIHVPRVENVVLGTVVLRWCDHEHESRMPRRA